MSTYMMFSHWEEREYRRERRRNNWDFEPKERLQEKFKMYSQVTSCLYQ